MANTVSIDALRQELWSADLMDDVMRDVENVMRFAGPDVNNVLQINKDLMKSKGDTETFGLVARLSGFGVTGVASFAVSSLAKTCAIRSLRLRIAA